MFPARASLAIFIPNTIIYPRALQTRRILVAMIVAYSDAIATIEASRLRPMEESFLCWGCKVKLPDHLDHDSHKADSEDLGRDTGIAESDNDLGKDKDNAEPGEECTDTGNAEPEEDLGKDKDNAEREDQGKSKGNDEDGTCMPEEDLGKDTDNAEPEEQCTDKGNAESETDMGKDKDNAVRAWAREWARTRARTSEEDLGKDKDNAEPEEDQGKSKGNDETEDLSEDSGSTDSDDDRFGCGNIRRGDVCMCLEKQAPGEIDCYFGDFLFIRETGVDGACVYARNLRTGVDGWLDVTVRGVEIRPIRCLADVLHWRDAMQMAAQIAAVWREASGQVDA